MKWEYGLRKLNGKEILPKDFDYINWLEDSLLVISKGEFQAEHSSKGTKSTNFEYVLIINLSTIFQKYEKEIYIEFSIRIDF